VTPLAEAPLAEPLLEAPLGEAPLASSPREQAPLLEAPLGGGEGGGQVRASRSRPKKKKRSSVAKAAVAQPVLARPKLFYVAQFGNNSPLFRQLMRNRPGWAAGPGDPGNLIGKTDYEEKRCKVQISNDFPEIQFLWTQYGETKYMDAVVEKTPGICVTLNEEYRLTLKNKKVEDEPFTGPRAHNHFEGNEFLCTKRGLCETMTRFYLRHGRDPFGAVPMTFVIRKGSQDDEFAKFRDAHRAIEASSGHRVWLVKPGEWANRGCGITIEDSAEEVATRVDSKEKVWVVQKYMERPLLIHGRKFDVRSWCLVTQDSGGGPFHAHHYLEAYLRTTSAQYDIKNLDRMIHLSNGPVQAKGEDYGKFECCNKLSLPEFQRYLNNHRAKDGCLVQEHIVPQMQAIMCDTIRAVTDRLNARGVDNCFEVFGFDFMIDANYRVWLIEVNTNPCYEPCCPYLDALIPKMLDEALRLTIDCIFPHAAAPAPPIGGRDGSRASAKKSSRGPRATGWQKIWSSTDADQVSCDWLPTLPPGEEVDLLSLGRDILGTPLKPQL